jgi:hypothetical protein
MDYFFKLQNLSQTRLKQLELESHFDKQLLQTYRQCPEITFKFVMSLRTLNRQFSSELYSSSIFEYHDKIIKNISLTDSLYLTDPPCDNLSKLID